MVDLERLAAGCLLASFPGPDPPRWMLDRLAAGLGGVVLFAANVAGAELPLRLTAVLRDAGPSALIALDEEGGDVTRLEAAGGSSWPGNAALGAIDDIAVTRAVAAAMGSSLGAAGIDMNLAPCADVNSDPANPVIGVRSFGADATLVARHVGAFVEGLQSVGVAACTKHFPGHGDTRVDSHLDLPVVEADRETLMRREIAPFVAAIDAGTAAIMSAHVVAKAIDTLPATLSRQALTELLRRELGFTGAVVTDALDMAAIAGTYGVAEAAVLTIAAGADLVCLGPAFGAEAVDLAIGAIAGAVVDGRLGEDRLHDAVERAAAVPRTPSTGHMAVDPGLGLVAARRAMWVSASVAGGLVATHVVELCPPAGIAAGPVPWGVGEPLRRLDPSTTVARLGVDGDVGGEVGRQLEAATGRPLVIVVRDSHRYPWQQAIATRMVAARPDAIVVDMGWPSHDVAGLKADICTYGASRVSGQAVAQLLFGKDLIHA